MSKWDTVAIVGVGLIGGSIGAALLRRRLTRRVIGIGRRQSSLRKARRHGTVTSTTTRLARGVAQADLIVVCTPVATIAKIVREAAGHCPPGALITDAGSTKAQLVAELDGSLGSDVEFIGSHPLAGSEKTGPDFARADLLEDRTVVITPTRRSSSAAVAGITRFWESLGARVVAMTPRAHDQAIAATSHLPHLVAAAVAGATPSQDLPLVAGGWLDTTRVAAGDVELWRQILTDNRDHVLKSLGKFEKVLASFGKALRQNDQAKITRLLEAAKENRDSVGS